MGPELKGSGKLRTVENLRPNGRASMGPELKGSGKRPVVLGHGRNRNASMGPELKGSGKLEVELIKEYLLVGFNGAGAEGLRKTVSDSNTVVVDNALQWGRS